MLQLRNRVRTAACPPRETYAVSARTIPSVDDITVAFRRICLKVTATNAGRVDGSIPTTCDALPLVIWFEKPYGRDSRGTSTSQRLFKTQFVVITFNINLLVGKGLPQWPGLG